MKRQRGKAMYTLTLKRTYPNMVDALNHRHEMYNAEMETVERLEREGMLLPLHPPKEIEIDTYTRDTRITRAMYERGLFDARSQMKQIKGFLYGKEF